jgi:Fe2+ transport system protein B
LENNILRKLTALLIPFMSCSARLPVYTLFAVFATILVVVGEVVVFNVLVGDDVVVVCVGGLLRGYARYTPITIAMTTTIPITAASLGSILTPPIGVLSILSMLV